MCVLFCVCFHDMTGGGVYMAATVPCFSHEAPSGSLLQARCVEKPSSSPQGEVVQYTSLKVRVRGTHTRFRRDSFSANHRLKCRL